jgi:hypothetical protein
MLKDLGHVRVDRRNTGGWTLKMAVVASEVDEMAVEYVR